MTPAPKPVVCIDRVRARPGTLRGRIGEISRAEREAIHEKVAARVRVSFASWAHLALPSGQRPAAHHQVLMRALRDVRRGRTDRLMVLMPPGSAKSTYGSVLFPPWWFARHPGTNVIAASHTASLAGSFGGRVRALIGEHSAVLGYNIAQPQARDDFNLSGGGTYFAVGVQGAVTGRRADLILIDDPVRSHEDAESERSRDNLWEWYRSDLLTRLKPGGRMVLIMTRWHPDDLGGRLLQSGDEWASIKLPALATGADDPLGRPLGAPLWPAWEDAAALERKRRIVGERAWAALYQQEPRLLAGQLFRTERIGLIDLAAPVRCVRAWDLAATSSAGGKNPDFTVGVKLGREPGGRFIIMDVVRIQGSPHEVQGLIERTAQADGTHIPISIPQDPGQAGKSQVQYLVAALAGFRVSASPETGDKRTRAGPVASQVEAGNFAMLPGEWGPALLEEMRDFPNGRKDDQVDALSRAFSALIDTAPMARRLSLGLTAR